MMIIKAQIIYDTNSVRQYEDANITCQNHLNCTIICDKKYGCKGTRVICPTDQHCDITCLADFACYNVCQLCNNCE